ncbi:RidA family protein [Pimelobacter sp. 30-1]|uniref:RidA family protein n=1 Tax=Pimelobacter TaxID=2044 RepID=UPI001C041538|nr:RidA family protein [Pimelobacter sp. 30-1]MBU2694022.1 enamine deaminase RidA [Pimelobacter sp. 30-1]
MTDHLVRPEGLPPSNGYSHVTVAGPGRVVHVSGQVPARTDGTVVDPADVTAQAEQVFEHLQTALAAAGAGWGDVVKMGYFLTDLADLPAVRAVRDRYLDPDRLPASSLVQVAGLVHPDFRVEIDAVAVVEG